MIDAALAICVYIYFSGSIFKSLVYISISEIAGLKVTLCLPFSGTTRLLSPGYESHFSHLEYGVHKRHHLIGLLESQGEKYYSFMIFFFLNSEVMKLRIFFTLKDKWTLF